MIPDPNPDIVSLQRRVAAIENILVSHGLVSPDQVLHVPEEYQFLARVMNRITEKIDRSEEDPT